MAIREIRLGPTSRMVEQGTGTVRAGPDAPTVAPFAAPVAAPQPPPRPGRGSVVDDLVVLLQARREFGKRKYGTELQPFNGRDAYVDALQELVDLLQYLHQAQMERAQLEQDLAEAQLLQARAAAELAATRANLDQARTDLDAEVAATRQLQGELRRSRTEG
jgi:hypothetical protein